MSTVLQTAFLETAKGTAIAATGGLSAAMKGLRVTLIANPLLLAIGTLTVDITIYLKFEQAHKEARRSALSTAKKVKNSSPLFNKYNKLIKIYDIFILRKDVKNVSMDKKASHKVH